MLIDPRMWAGDAIKYHEIEHYHIGRMKRVESLGYQLKQELPMFVGMSFDGLFHRGMNHPKILKMYLGRQVSLETLSTLVYLVDCADYWKESDDILLQEMALKAYKYWPFLAIQDDTKLRNMVLEHFSI